MTTLCDTKLILRIIRATHLGMCFGVRDAITLAKEKAATEPITILGELVHNESVLDDLRRRGVEIESDPARVATRLAVVTAHGASNKAMERARNHGLELIEATCPLVHFAHQAVRRLVAEGYHPVIIGRRHHVEVRGLTEDLEVFDIIESEEDILALKFQPRFGVAAQTTQPIARVRALVEALRKRFPESEVQFVDTVCQPTKQRQRAAEDLAREADAVIVIGGANSNNTRELVRTCSKFCDNVHHVQGPGDLRPEWFAAGGTVGITAGTSTPDYMIDAVENAIRKLA